MASDIAAPQQQPHLSHPDSMDTTSSQDASLDSPTVNGDRAPTNDTTMQQGDSNISDAPSATELSPTETAIDTKVSASTALDPHPAGPTPVDDITSGIQPIADFLPKDASNLSHPTPPPDEPITTGEADVDIAMENAGSGAQSPADLAPAPTPELPSAQSEQSLVRPREDDDEDEPAAKRSKVDDDILADVDAPVQASLDAPMVAESEEVPTTTVVEPATEPVNERTVQPVIEPSTEAVVESVVGPVSESAEDLPAESTDTGVKMEATQSGAPMSDAPVESLEVSEAVAPIAESPIEQKPTDDQATIESQPQPPTETTAAPTTAPMYSTEPMTTVQRSTLLDKTKNLKKTKSAVAFLRPVDPVALGIPNYTEVVKEPMDVGTMEAKLKEGKYASVQDYVNDFDLIISNVRRFNGDQHAVTQQGFNMRAYFYRMMETVPTADIAEPPKVQKKRSPSLPQEKPIRRESRAAAAPASAPAPAPVPTPALAPAPSVASTSAPGETYALQADGTPQIRRQSSNRPARAIKPPQNREIPYAKPKRKEHQLELKFCENVLDEIRSAKYGTINHVFLHPVDPVALNIPHYRQVIKTPMDLSTMSQKLKNGQYATATEFKKDFDLIVKNCLSFNPVGNPVRDLGISVQREFEALWANKDKWERKNQPPSNRGSSASGDEDSGADEDEEEEDDEEDKSATIRALQKQLADMQNALTGLVPGLGADKPAKSKKAKSGKGSSKKIGSISSGPSRVKAPAKPASRPKKPKQVTYEEKQEISEAVARMDDKQVGRLTEIITQNCAKYRDMEEMELEIDDLPNDVQVMLLEYVRKTFGNPNKKKARDLSPDDAAALDDDDFEPERGARGGKRKKHRPMGKKEQQETIDSIQKKLAEFEDSPKNGSDAPTKSSFNAANVQADTSGDDESEESEEE